MRKQTGDEKYGKRIYSEVSDRWVFPMVKIWEDFMQHPKPDGCVIHHLDGNKKNNDILNLVCIEKEEHDRWHASHRSEYTNKLKSDRMKSKIWINNGKINKRCDIVEDGWAMGRINFPEYKTVKCPHCGKEGKSTGMGRWHFDNCTKGVIHVDAQKEKTSQTKGAP